MPVPGLKASADLPSEEEQQQQQQPLRHSSDSSGSYQQVAPLRMDLKPIIQEAVLLQRAVAAAQQVRSTGLLLIIWSKHSDVTVWHGLCCAGV